LGGFQKQGLSFNKSRMKTYYFYIKNDQEKEPINIIRAIDLHEAIRLFCMQKQLEEEDFLEIYQVELN
jgi:hypothetical protein